MAVSLLSVFVGFLSIIGNVLLVVYIARVLFKDLYYSYFANLNDFKILKKFTWHQLVEFTGDLIGKQYVYKYPMAGLAGDSVVYFRKEDTDDLYVLMIRRSGNTKPEQFQNTWALPGGFFDVNSDESMRACALRELKEETGVDLRQKNEEDYTLSHIADKIGRDPRHRTISTVFKLNLGIQEEAPKDMLLSPEDTHEVAKAKWVNVTNTHESEFAFDHFEVIKRATS